MIYVENKNQNVEIRFPKSITNGASAAYLYLENHLGSYTLNVVDTSNYSNYYVFSLNFSSVADGEYYAYLQDASKNVLAQTIMYVGVSDEDEIDYEYYEEPEVDVEFDPNLITINPFDVEIIDRNNVVSYYHFEDGIVPDEYFNSNENIVSVRFGDSITTVGDYAFASCMYLQRIEWGGVTHIGIYGFAWNYSLTSLTIPSQMEFMGEGAFEINNLLSLTFEDGYSGETDGGVFADNYNLTSVTFSNTQTSIGDYDFSACESLAHVTVPDSVTYIGDGAFGYTTLEDITIGSGVTEVGSSAFVGCENLTAINITATIAPTLGGEPFEDVAEVGVLTYPSGSDYSEWYEWLPYGWNPDAVISRFYLDDGSVSLYGSMEIFDRYFSGIEDIVRIEFGEGLEGIEENAIENLPNLTSVTFPSSMTSISDSNFEDCSNLAQIICNATTAPQLGDGVFDNIAEEGTLVIPNGADYSSWYAVLPIGWNPNVHILTITHSDGTTEVIKTLDNEVDNTHGDDTTVVAVTVGEGFTSIGDNAFSYCDNLSSVTLPSTLTSIGDYTFSDCENLKNMFIPINVTNIGETAFYHCLKLESINLPNGLTTIKDYTFTCCPKLSSITIPDNVTSIGECAFEECYDLTTINISPKSKLTTIGQEAFFMLDKIESIYLPSGVTSIGNLAYSDCYELSSITIDAVQCPQIGEDAFNSVADVGVLNYPEDSNYTAFYNALPIGWRPEPSEYQVTLHLTNGTVQTDSFETSVIPKYTYNKRTDIVSVEIGSGITAIDSARTEKNGNNIAYQRGTFCGCSNLTSVTIPDSVTSIGAGCFENCSNLTRVVFGNGLTTIDNFAFSNCSNLSTLTLPNSLTTIGQSVFYYCTNIYGTLTIPDNVTEIGESAFDGCSSLTTLTFGQNSQCTSIGKFAFRDCSGLSHIYLPSSLQSIGNSGFKNCSELLYITCSATTAPTLGSTVFRGVGSASSSLTRGTLTYPTGSDYSTWYAQLPEKFNPNYNPGGGGGIEDDFE